MPANGLGMCCRPTAYDDVLVRRTILWYLLLGGRHIDTAHLYLNHHAVGLGIQDAVARGVPRSEIFVTSKIFPSHFGYQTTKDTVPKLLEDLQLEYIDLLLMHFPSRIPVVATSRECRFRFDPFYQQSASKTSDKTQEGLRIALSPISTSCRFLSLPKNLMTAITLWSESCTTLLPTASR